MTGRFACFMISTAFSQIGRSKVTIATLSAESRMHSLRVVKMVLRSLGSPSMTGRKSICVLCFASHACILFIQPFQLECGNSGSWALITHLAAQSEEWLVMSQEVGKLSDGEKHDDVYSCLFPVGKWKNLHFSSSQGLNFVECLQLHHEDSCCCLLIWQRW